MARSTVLIVEDEEPLRINLRRIARGCGFDVLTVVDGEEAISALSTTNVDIVVTDLVMPRMDGYSLLRWMYERGMTQPVVVMSGYTSLENTVEALRLGAYDYISKPFKLEDVEASLRRAEVVIERRRADAALRRRTRELAALNIISTAVNSSLEFDEMLDRALGATLEALDMLGALVFFGDAAHGMRFYRGYGASAHLAQLIPPQLAAPSEYGVAIGEVQIAQLLGLAEHIAWNRNEALKAAIPLLANGALGGLILLIGGTEQQIHHDQLALLESIGNYIGVAITNSRLYSQVRASAYMLEQVVEQRTQELQHSRDLLRTIFDGLPAGLLLVDAKDRILATNLSYAKLFGQEPSALVDQSYHQLWASSGIRVASDLVQRCIHGAQPVYQRDRLERAGQTTVVLDRYLFPVQDAQQRVMQVIEYLEDVTERLALESLLAETEQLAALGKLAAKVAHEVNTPLMAIRGCLGLIANPQSDAHIQAEYLELAESELDRAASIIQGILDFYRSEGTERVITDLNALIERAAHVLKARCTQQNIIVDMQLAPSLPAILTTPDHIKQVVLNLMLNALEALPSSGRITLRTMLRHANERQVAGADPHVNDPALPRVVEAADPTHTGASFIMIQVEDNGSGIAEPRYDSVFDAFAGSKTNGNDLGLAVCRTIVRDHGGSISAENLAEGGTRFTVTLPVVTDEAKAQRWFGPNGHHASFKLHP